MLRKQKLNTNYPPSGYTCEAVMTLVDNDVNIWSTVGVSTQLLILLCLQQQCQSWYHQWI